MKKTVIIILIFAALCNAQNKKGSIKGVIKTSDDQPVELVDVILKGSPKGTISNAKGEYKIENINPGVYKLGISYMGFRSVEIEVEVKPGETTQVPVIYLRETEAQLHEITVTGNKVNKLADIESQYIAKLHVRNMENPQSYSLVPAELLTEENITDYSSALKTIPGGVLSSENPQGISATYIRGFQTNSFLRNGLYSFSWNGGDPEVMDRIELIKGPSGSVYGTWGVAYGGLINIVTKKPFNGNYFQSGISFGSYNLQKFTGDFNTVIDEKKDLFFRLNAAAYSEGSFQDIGYKKTYLISPSISYKVNDRLNLTLEAEFNSLDFSPQSLFSGAFNLTVNSIDQIKRNYFKSYSSDKINNPPGSSNNYFGQINYDLTSTWRLSTNFAFANFSLKGTSILLNFLNDSLLSRGLYDYFLKINNTDIQENLTGEFFIAGLKNRFLFGIDYQWIDVTTSGDFIFAADTLYYTKNTTPVLNINKLRTNYNFSLNTYESRNSYAIYISDFINIIPELDLMFSLRYDYNDYNGLFDLISGSPSNKPYLKGALSPQIGLTYQIISDKVSLFGNYMQGFNYVQPDLLGHSFDPEYAEQLEGGIKCILFENRLFSTLSFYNINVRNKVHPDRTNPLASIQNGTQISRGIDMDLRANPLAGLNLIAGFEYNFSKFTKGDINIEGKRPAGTPPNTANLWSSYIIQKGTYKGLGIGLGFIFSDDFYYDDKNLLAIPSYLVLKGNIFYEIPQFRISFLVDNLTDKRYWDFNGTPQMPEKYELSMNLNLN